MGLCFSKPKKKELLAESRERIDVNIRTLTVCAELAEGEDISVRVSGVFDAVRYMTPSLAVQVMQIDKKIGSLAGDLKIALTKGRDRDLAHAEDIVRDIEIAVAERNSYK